jgi:hypothetical protein
MPDAFFVFGRFHPCLDRQSEENAKTRKSENAKGTERLTRETRRRGGSRRKSQEEYDRNRLLILIFMLVLMSLVE